MVLGSRVVSFRLPAVKRLLCRQAFCTLLGITSRTLTNNTDRPDGLTAPPPHGLANRPSNNALRDDKLQEVISYVLTVAKEEGIPNPRFAFSRQSADGPDLIDSYIHLPPRFTLGALYYDYCKYLAAAEKEELIVSKQTFHVLFKERDELRHVKTSVRSRGVCELCKDLRLSLQACGSDVRMAEVQKAYQEHLNAADLQRSMYQERLEESVAAWDKASGRLATGMISFDYASKHKVPTTSAQTQGEFMGEEFGLDVFLFGITNEGSRTYYNYYYPEGYSSGDPNTVISMVHQHLCKESRLASCKKLIVYTDSCSGQNRNRFVYSYFITRILGGYHDEISWNFMVVGHTKFSPDRGFGLMRKQVERHDAFTVPHLVAINNALTATSTYKCVGLEADVDEFRDYKSCIDKHFTKLVGIKKKRIGEIILRAAEMEGKRTCKAFYRLVGSDEVTEVGVLKRGHSREGREQEHLQFPGDEVLTTDKPPVMPRKIFSYDRWAQLMEILERCVGVPEDAMAYYRAIPHLTRPSKSKRKARDDALIDQVGGEENAQASVSEEAETSESSVEVLGEKRGRVSGDVERLKLIANPDGYVPRWLRDLPSDRSRRRTE